VDSAFGTFHSDKQPKNLCMTTNLQTAVHSRSHGTTDLCHSAR